MGFIIDDDEVSLEQEEHLPLIGLYSVFKEMKELEYEKVLVLPCDAPLVKFEVVKLLIKRSKNFDCCIPKWNDNLLEPLLAIYPIKSAYETARYNIRESQYKLTKIISKDWKINYVSIEDEIKKVDPNLFSFKNINTREDIKIIEAILNKTK